MAFMSASVSVLVAGSRAHAIDVSAAGFNPQEIVAQQQELLVDAIGAAFPDGDRTNHGADADSDSEQGQRGAEFVPAHRPQRRANDCSPVHGQLGCLTFPSWSSAARKAAASFSAGPLPQ